MVNGNTAWSTGTVSCPASQAGRPLARRVHVNPVDTQGLQQPFDDWPTAESTTFGRSFAKGAIEPELCEAGEVRQAAPEGG